MPNKTKYKEIARLIELRIRAGDYALAELPGERKLAVEFGVSHMTARRAVQLLLDSGVLVRPAKASLKPARPHLTHSGAPRVALLSPAFESLAFRPWYFSAQHVVADRGGLLRPVPYVHENDRVITDVLDSDIDGILFLPPQSMSRMLVEKLKNNRCRLVTLFSDMTELGIPCVDNGVPLAGAHLVEHLARLGHRTVDILNTQPMDATMQARIRAVEARILGLGLKGMVHNFPVEPYEYPDLRAYKVISRLLDSGGLASSALVCITFDTALGAMRAASERGLRIGSDLSVAAYDGLRYARMLTPSLTTLDQPDPAPFLNRALDWIQSRGRKWKGPLAIMPEDVPVWVGESTGPAPRPKPADG